jgi:hypothetical protein
MLFNVTKFFTKIESIFYNNGNVSLMQVRFEQSELLKFIVVNNNKTTIFS